MADFPQNMYDNLIEYQDIYHTSGIVDADTRIQHVSAVKTVVEYWIEQGIVNSNDDPQAVTKRAYENIFPDDNVAVLKPERRYNLLYPKKFFEGQGVDNHNWVANGANYLATDWNELELGLLRDEGFSEAKLEQLKKDTVGESFIHQTLKFVGADDFAKQWENKILDDIKNGNAENMFTQLIPRTRGKDGYWIGVFWHPPNTSSNAAELVGGMLHKGKLHVVPKEQLLGASISEHLLQYVQSWYFDYNHENIIKLYEEGRKEGGTQGHGWWNPKGGYFNEDREDEEGDWMMDNLRRTIHLLGEKVGDVEFKYAIKPLYEMMQAEAAKLNKELLDEEEAQDVLRKYMDRHDRFYKRMLKNEPLSWLRVPARWISNFYEIDLNPREIFN